MKKKPRAKRKITGYRDAASGEYVTEEFAAENPGSTVAITEEVKTAQEAADDYVDSLWRERGDEEC